MSEIKLEVILSFAGEPNPDDVRERVDAMLEAARKDSQFSGDDLETSCDDIVVHVVEE